MITKKELLRKFRKDYKRYWKVDLFEKLGFVRKQCTKCKKFFWTLDPEKKICGDSSCQDYTFIGHPPTKKRLNYINTWKKIEKFFVKNNHNSIKRYPVICRWRPDMYFTDASIVDFQRVENGYVTFEFPSNPLIIPQMSLRFNDIPNVGINGRSYTGFCMVGQHSLYNGKKGYWKDRCIDLDFNLLTNILGISPEDITFIEDVWKGAGAFGYSLEFFAGGLELGNAVFTEFVETSDGYHEMEEKVIDMGAGLERLSWITQGTPTSYNVVFGPVLEKVKKETGIIFPKIFNRYSSLAAKFNIDGLSLNQIDLLKKDLANKLDISLNDLKETIAPCEAIYAVLDHTRSLLFAIADGGIPSNVGGGHNLRVILRRTLQFIDKFGWDLDIIEVCNWHADFLKPLFPELSEHKEEISEILNVEKKRYRQTKKKTKKIVRKLKKDEKEISEKKMIDLYDTKGISPELIKEEGLEIEIPPDFYVKVTEKHLGEEIEEEKIKFDIRGLPKTRLLYYEDPDKYEFEAEVIKIIGNRFVILNQTGFYPRSGGQEPDHGSINGCKVVDVDKAGKIVIHELEKINFEEGDKINGKIDKKRREILKKHHTATHIINYASREVLGPHVWQSGAKKSLDKARLDITHYKNLSDKKTEQIESLANQIVKKDLPVDIEWLTRQKAEKKYGFRLYQGGVPSKKVRVVSIDDIEHEACGGLHCESTGEVGFISIIGTKRIQDGVTRIVYIAGSPALGYLRKKEKILKEAAKILRVKEEKVPEATHKLFLNWKKKRKSLRKLEWR